jgi:hypothetical protein
MCPLWLTALCRSCHADCVASMLLGHHEVPRLGMSQCKARGGLRRRSWLICDSAGFVAFVASFAESKGHSRPDPPQAARPDRRRRRVPARRHRAEPKTPGQSSSADGARHGRRVLRAAQQPAAILAASMARRNRRPTSHHHRRPLRQSTPITDFPRQIRRQPRTVPTEARHLVPSRSHPATPRASTTAFSLPPLLPRSPAPSSDPR